MTMIKENISANTLFHFTPTLSNLKNILENGIKIGFSLENYDSLLSKNKEIGLPMICFCDIPLSRVKEHVKKYGGYAIGLQKSWGMQNKLTPVIYSHENSPATELLNEINTNIKSFIEIHDKYKPNQPVQKDKSMFNLLLDNYNKIYNQDDFKHKKEINTLVEALKEKISIIYRYVKPYKGKCFRNGTYLPDEVEFYNEKEWRFVPTKEQVNKIGLKDTYDKKYLTELKYKRAINIKCNKLKLKFIHSDVRFIIVNKENEINSLIEHIDTIDFNKSSNKSLQILKTRIISLEQIIDDL